MTSGMQSPPPSGNGRGPENTPSSTPYSTDRLAQIRASALQYAARGWAVLPVHGIINSACTCGKRSCSSTGKHPRTPNGVKDATTDLTVVLEWWEKWPNSNIGIATGKASGLLAVDVDPRNGGDGTIDALTDTHGGFPDTVEALTGGGGRHLLFAYPTDGSPITGTVLDDGVDIKSDGGYIVAAPSMHASGGQYEWELSSDPSDTELAAPPDWPIERLRNPLLASKKAAAGNDRLDPAAILSGVSVGERNDTVFRYFCRLRDKNLTWDECLVLGRQIVAASPKDPPFTEQEMIGCLDSAFKYEPGKTEAKAAPNKGESEGFHIVHGDEIENLPEPEWLIEDVLVRGSLAVLYGASGSYKSFLSLDMGGAVSTGVGWHGHEVHQGNVVYIAAEGVGDLGVRIKAYKIAHDLESLPDVSYVLEPVNLYTGDSIRGQVDGLIEQIAHLDPALVIFDTLARCMAGGDENFAKDINSVIASLDRLRHETGATVLVIHHSGHDKNRERGSSALKAASDTFIKQKAEKGKATLVCDKMKYGPGFPDITLEMIEAGDSLAVVSDPVTPELKEEKLACLRLVSADGTGHGDWKRAFIRADFGSESSFNRYLKDLVKDGLVEKDTTVDPALYRLTDQGAGATGVSGVTEVSSQI